MNTPRTKFYRDKINGKIMGVCAGIADYTGVDVLWVRLGAVALTLMGVWTPEDIIPPVTPYYVMKVGHVPLVPYHRPGDPDVATRVAALIEEGLRADKPLRAVMIERLGPNVWHRSLSAAMAALEELEETAKLWLLSGRAVEPLTDEAIAELKLNFKLRY